MSQALTPAVGSKVGRYSLAAESPEVLAASSFVGRAEDGHLARVLLVSRAGTDVDALQRAASQVRTLAHPNVLGLAEVDPVEGRLAISFEHAEGASLQTLVTAAGSHGLAQKVAVKIVLDVLEGLSAAHASALAHGELGPHLVWVGADGRARVVGTGIAKVLGKALAPKTPSDRLAYIAPERVKPASTGGSPVADARCDVFSAAVILWELLGRQRLFAGRLESAVIQKVLTAPVAPLAATADDLPDNVDEVLKKALERDPSRRTPSAKELSEALAAAFADGIATAEEVGHAVEELAKKPLADLRARLAEAGAADASTALPVPPARASFPTLDDSFVQTDDAPAPVVRVAPKPPVPPRAAPKPIVKAPVKPIEVKVADAKDEAKADDAKVDAKADDAKVDSKAADAKDADESKEIEITLDSADTGDTGPDAATVPGKVAGAKAVVPKVGAAAPKVGVIAPRVGPAAPVAKKPMPSPRKGTLLGMAPPSLAAQAAAAKAEAKIEADKAAAVAAKADGDKAAAVAAKADGDKAAAVVAKGDAPVSPDAPTVLTGEAPPAPKAEAAGTPKPPESGDKASEKAADAAAPSSAKVAVAEASAPASKTPAPVSITKPSGDPEPTPSSSGGPALSERKKAALPGNLKPGDSLGRYELLLPVASGGMASVWAARLEGTAGFQKIVAIKTMLPGMSADADFEEMFLDEARVAARIRHPNVVEIFDLGEEGETLYLVMEWVDGETFGALQKGSKKQGGVPMPILLRLASQACAGLHAAHELRDDKGALVDLVHRDISPANILVSKTGFVKIVDFGVAKSKARMYTTRVGGMIKGKTPYLSPEQLAGQPIDRRSDLYSFGAVLYVMATGLHPFRGETEAKTIENIALRDPVSLRKLEPSIHADFEAIVLKALEKDPAKRFQSASEMQRAIDTLAASIGQTVNDDDVAAFVRKVTGDSLEKRSAALRDAIQLADAGKQPIAPRSQHLSEPSKLETPAVADAADAANVEIDDIDLEADAKAKASGVPSKPAIPPPPPGDADALFNAPSLGSDAPPMSPPVDTLAAASTEPALDDDAPAAPRSKKPMMVVGGVLGLCAIIGVIALVGGGGGDKPSASTKPTAAVVSTGSPDTARTGQPADTAPATTPASTATEAPVASATATATAEPTPTAEPVATTPEPAATATAAPDKTAPVTAAAKPTAASKPVVVATKPTATGAKTAPKGTAKPPATSTKPPKKFEPTGL